MRMKQTYSRIGVGHVRLLFGREGRGLALVDHGTAGNRTGVASGETGAGLTGHLVLV